MTRATNFFVSTVKPTAEEFLSDIANIRRARLAAIVLNQMADYWAFENRAQFVTPNVFRIELEQQCPQFSIIWAAADATKHVELTHRPSRKLTSTDQIRLPPGLFQAPFGEGLFAEAMEVIVQLDDETHHPFAPVVQAVLSTWQALVA